MLFGTRIGFSGTPSSLLPLEMGECAYEQGDDAKMLRALTEPSVVAQHELQVLAVQHVEAREGPAAAAALLHRRLVAPAPGIGEGARVAAGAGVLANMLGVLANCAVDAAVAEALVGQLGALPTLLAMLAPAPPVGVAGRAVLLRAASVSATAAERRGRRGPPSSGWTRWRRRPSRSGIAA